ncbi:MAG: hypothetical protein ACYSTL_08715, partial [Planctomycetota bacterium]
MPAEMWTLKKIIFFSVPFALLAFALIAWLFLRKTVRTRFRMEKQLRQDPDINEWLVVFNWSRKVLYIPTILASLVAFVIMLIARQDTLVAEIVGGCWLGIFFLNFLVDEYEISIKVLLIGFLCIIVLLLWLTFMDWLDEFLRFFRHLDVTISATGYLMITIVFSVAV